MQDHQLSRYVEVIGAACGLKVAPLLAPLVQPGPLPLAPRPNIVARASLQRTSTNPEVWAACRTQTDPESELPETEGGLVVGVASLANNLASWAMPAAMETKADAHAHAHAQPVPEPEPEPEPEPQPQPQPQPQSQPEPDTDEI